MSFRRKKETAPEARLWSAFLDENRFLLEQSALPFHIYETRGF